MFESARPNPEELAWRRLGTVSSTSTTSMSTT